MNGCNIGALIRSQRLASGLTQAALASLIHVSAAAVSKWERNAGLPDPIVAVSLSRVLGLSSDALLTGLAVSNPHDGGNMKHIQFYQCPDCGALLTAAGRPEITCCGRRLTPMQTQPADDAHALTITGIETEKLVQWSHPMEKAHHLTFLAAVGYDSVHIVRLYPEGAQEHRLPCIPWVKYVCGCSEEPGILYVSQEDKR